MRTGCLVGEPPEPEKEIFMKSKPQWVPQVVAEESCFEAMPALRHLEMKHGAAASSGCKSLQVFSV